MATVLDLRGPDPAWPGRLPEQGGQVIVLDDAKMIGRHADTYLRLVENPATDKVICIAVGDAERHSLFEGVALEVPPALAEEAVLWVGDTGGLDWASHGTAPHRPQGSVEALDQLLAALNVEQVFNRVWQETQALPSRAASPGIRLAFGPIDPAALAEAGAAAVKDLRMERQDRSVAWAEDAKMIDAEHQPKNVKFAAPLRSAADEARRRIQRVTELVGELGSWHAAAGWPRTAAELATDIGRAEEAADRYRAVVTETLNRMDGHLQNGHPPAEAVREFGVPAPAPARSVEVAAGLRERVSRRLDDDVDLSTLAEELKLAAKYAKPQGVTKALSDLRRLGRLRLDRPSFPRRPIPQAVLPVASLSGLAMVVLSGSDPSGLLFGALLVALWFGLGWLLLASRPDTSGPRGFGATLPTAAAVYGVAPALGVGAGEALVRFLPGTTQVPNVPALFSGFAALAILIAGVCWRVAVRRWKGALGLRRVKEMVAVLDRVAANALRDEWLPMPRRRLIAGCATALANEVDGMRGVLGETDGRLFVTGSSPCGRPDDSSTAQPTPEELFAIVRSDLVRLFHQALNPVWPVIEAGRPPTVPDRQRLRRLLADYDSSVMEKGLMCTPDDAGSRARLALMERVWTVLPETPKTLRAKPLDEMRQLCASWHLSYLSGSTEPALVRFAPRHLREVLADRPTEQSVLNDPGIEWTEGSELIGALRLVPLRAESVRHGWMEY